MNDGGYAFPVGHPKSQSGMSMRDWFAAQAIMGVINQSNRDDPYWKMSEMKERELAAELAYSIADAMLKAREKQ